LRLRPRDPYFLNNRGYIRLMMGDMDAALSDIDESIVEDPGNAWAYRNKGIYYLKTGDAQNAIRLLSRALEMSDFIEQGQYYLGEAYLANHQKQAACEHFSEAVKKQEMTEVEFRKKCR
jgi:tetratricopeptide (TPR) repeat protein